MKANEFADRSSDFKGLQIMQYYRAHPEFLHQVQSLAEVVHEYNQGNPWPAVSRIQRFPCAHLEIPFLVESWNRMALENIEPLIIPYDAGTSTSDHLSAVSLFNWREHGLSQPPQLLRTITSRYTSREGANTILISGVGNFQVNKLMEKNIAAAFELSSRAVKNAQINPDAIYFEPDWLLGQAPGWIKPIFHGNFDLNISGIYYHQDPQQNKDIPVAITTSPFEMLVMPQSLFEKTLHWYAKTYYKNLQRYTSENTDIYINREIVTPASLFILPTDS